MKRFILFLIILSAALPPISAQAQTDQDLIVLNDSTPGIDVVINPSLNTTGVVALEIGSASVIVTDAVGNVVFQAADPAIAGVEFSFAPNAGTHTLTVERLPGAVQGYVRITSLPEMTPFSETPQLVNASVLTVDQESDFPLNAASPSSVVNFVVPTAATVTARFPGAPVTAQLVDTQTNLTLASLNGSLIDGVRFKVADGTYELLLLNNNAARETVANVSVMSPLPSDFDSLVAQAETSNMTALATTAPVNTGTSTVSTCTITINASSVNVRSGPGTGYSVLDYAFRGEMLPVGGMSTQSGWVLVGTDTGSGWLTNEVGMFNGDCTSLTAYDIPYREASAPEVTIQQPAISVYHDDDDDDEYEEHDDQDEHEDDDDD
jgi:uncharacterized protein YraI